MLCDRYIDSSFAYQAYARGLGEKFVREINAFAMRYMPDVTLFLDLEPEAAFRRKGGADKADRVELSGLDFHKKVIRRVPRPWPAESPERVVRIDAAAKNIRREKKSSQS